jgi:sulfate adenylyltransferase subunit 1 (EFTu-like GTPase family)
MSFAKIICRIETRIPICVEKFDSIEQMGRFTLRDEGMTLGSGKILKYKPIKVKTMPDLSKIAEEEEKKKLEGGGG